MNKFLIQINKIGLGIEFLKFKFRYPSVRFIRPRKTIGTYYSQDGQDILMAALLFPLIESGGGDNLIIDIGANHPSKFSNSYFLEKYFGCKTLAIEPLVEFGDLWNRERPNAEFLPVALGSKDDLINLNIPIEGDSMFSSLQGGVVKKMHEGAFELREVKVCRLDNILKERKITDVLLISIDVEGFEMEVLKGINFKTVSVAAIILENNSNEAFGSDMIRDYLIQQGYIYYARVGWLDDVFVLPSTLKQSAVQ